MNADDISNAIKFLHPTAEFSFIGEDYSTIKWDVLEGEAPTWAEVQAAHQAVQQAEAEAQVAAKAQKQALLNRLGITEEEAKLLLGGN